MTKRKQEAAEGLQSIMFLHPFASVRPQTAEERQAVVEDGRWGRTGGGGETGSGGGRAVVDDGWWWWRTGSLSSLLSAPPG